MGWRPEDVPNPQDPATFASAKLDWAEAEQGHHAELLATYRHLISLRRDRAELRDADFTTVSVDFDEDGRWIVLHRGHTSVLLNLGEHQVSVPVRAAGAEVLLSTVDGVGLLDDAVQLPPHASLVLSRAEA